MSRRYRCPRCGDFYGVRCLWHNPDRESLYVCRACGHRFTINHRYERLARATHEPPKRQQGDPGQA